MVNRHFTVERTDIIHSQRETTAELLLETAIDLICNRPFEVRIERRDLVQRQEAGVSTAANKRQGWKWIGAAGKFRRVARVRMSHRSDLAERGANSVGSEVRGQLPQVAGDSAIEETGGGVEDRLAVTQRIKRKTDAGRDVAAGCVCPCS